jgi:hypothetical protein
MLFIQAAYFMIERFVTTLVNSNNRRVHATFLKWGRYAADCLAKHRVKKTALLSLNRIHQSHTVKMIGSYFRRWTHLSEVHKFRGIYNTIATNLQSHLDDMRRSLTAYGDPKSSALEAVRTMNRELHLLKDEQFRVIEEYQLRVLYLDKGPIASRVDTARQFLMSREREIISARAEAQILKHELDILLGRISCTPLFDKTSTKHHDKNLNTKLHINSSTQLLEKPEAVRVIISELHRLQSLNTSLSLQVQVLKDQVTIAHCIVYVFTSLSHAYVIFIACSRVKECY